MEVQTISTEFIKPSTPTPSNLRIHKLCALDQVIVELYIPVVLFYSPHFGEESRNASDFLKRSLSEALTVFYPLAGRIRNDRSCVDCSDDGVTFVEAKVDAEMSVALEQQNTTEFLPLIPCKQHDKASETAEQVLLAVQVNYFKCGGIGIGVCMWHEIGDGSSLGHFLNIWGAIARGGAVDNKTVVVDGAVVDCTPLFPPLDSVVIPHVKLASAGGVATVKNGKRFVVDGYKLSSLRQVIGSETTTFDAVSAILWAAAVATTEHKRGENLVFPMNLRKRLDPPLPEHSLGNFFHTSVAEWPRVQKQNTADYDSLAEAVRSAKRIMTNDYIRRCHDAAEGGYLKFLGDDFTRHGHTIAVAMSSWCGFSFYDADFGWGKPIYVCPVLSYEFTCVLMDTKDGEGIEVWVGLPEEYMEKFLQDPGIINYTSFSHQNI